MLNFNKKSRKGFTLVELLVVIAIIGILAAIAIPRFTDASANARGAKIAADLRTLDSAITLYYTNTGAYPDYATLVATGTGLLAAEPIPQTGDIVVNGHSYNVATGTTAYAINSTSHRATLVVGAGTLTRTGVTAGAAFASGATVDNLLNNK